MSTELLDLARSGLVGLAGVILGMVCFVFWTYMTRLVKGDRRLLPRHIVYVSFSYALLVIVTAGNQIELIQDNVGITWRFPLVVVAYVTGVVSLRMVMLHITRRPKSPGRRAEDP